MIVKPTGSPRRTSSGPTAASRGWRPVMIGKPDRVAEEDEQRPEMARRGRDQR